MKRFSVLSLILAALTLCSCGGREDGQTVSMLVTQGFSEKFYRTLADDVKKDLGIDIEFVYENCVNQSSMILQDFVQNDLKADIVFTYTKVPNRYLEDCCLDFMSRSDLMSHYSYSKVREFMSEDGCAYQLPLSSRLVGITYNATLMEEKGWKLPSTYQDMLDLKRKCDAEGIPFAVTDIKYTGHGFNFLFNVMGPQWLFTVKGESWLNGFLNGNKSAQVFKEAADYFRRWVEDGLFGDLADIKSAARIQFGQRRALFCFTNRNNFTGYSGPMCDREGNPTGVMLNDRFKTMPWISEDGSNNCFTMYDNCWVMVDRTVEHNKAKLDAVLSVLEYMMCDKYVSLAMDEAADVYCAFNDIDIREDRLFYDYADHIRRGFLQPWYYYDFEETTIIETGTEIVSYIYNVYRKNGWPVDQTRHINYVFNLNATFDSAMGMLRNSLHAQQEDFLGWAEEFVDYPGVARMTAIAGAMTLQEQLLGEEVTAALMPYVRDIKDLQPWKAVSVQNTRVYPGVLKKGYSFIFEPPGCPEIVGVRMSGARLREIVSAGYDPSDYFIDPVTGQSTFDIENYGPYPYALEIKGGASLEDDREYLVALSPATLEKKLYDAFLEQGSVLKKGGHIVSGNLANGITLYFLEHPTISNSNISW